MMMIYLIIKKFQNLLFIELYLCYLILFLKYKEYINLNILLIFIIILNKN